MKIISLFVFLIFIAVYTGVSCTPPGTPLESRSEDRDDDDDDDDDRRRTRTCSDRDSCQDICDDMFEYTTERYKCYDLGYEEVNTISKVWDEFSRNSVRSSELEDLDADDVRSYLELGFESFIDLVKGEAVGDSVNKAQWNPDGDDNDRTSCSVSNKNCIANNARKIMKWLAEEDDIAEIFLEQDRDFELGLELFQAINHTKGSTNTAKLYALNGGRGSTTGVFEDAALTIIKVATATSDYFVCFDKGFPDNDDRSDVTMVKYADNSTCGSPSKQMDLRFDRVSRFLSGFLVGSNSNSFTISEFSNESFMTFAADERNEKAFEWGHKTLLEFCKEATDEDEDDVEVKTCLQTVYCMHRKVNDGLTSEGIFEDLEDYDDIVGRTNVRYCESLDDEDRMEDLFE